jgi:cell filamentation protein
LIYTAEQDPLCYPNTTVLINLADLRDQAELDDFEFAMYLSRAEEPLPPGHLDYEHYRAMHHHLFQDVYSWAGQARTIRIGKAGNWFCYPKYLDRHMGDVFASLAGRNNLVELTHPEFVAGAAYVLAEINAGHPFREGNGRTQLAFLKVLALNAGRDFDEDAIEPETTLAAMIESFSGNLKPLEALIGVIVPR